MRIVTYITKFLESKGIDVVFVLQGGMITHMIDEIQTQGGITIVSVHHEQTAAMAADAYARTTNKPGVALATSGPGATNLITGIGNCYFDSVPAIFITGQVNLNEQKGDRPIRQLGFQETDIVSIVKPITKAAYAITSGKEVPKIFQEAYEIATKGRPGPVLIDIPMNIQKEECEDFDNKAYKTDYKYSSIRDIKQFIKILKRELSTAKRPLLLLGRGVRAAEVTDEIKKLIDNLNIPVVLSLNGIDVIPYNHPSRVGFIGTYGNRWANYALGVSDVLLVLGSRLDLRQTGSDIPAFSKGKMVFHVDIEKGELNNRIPTYANLNTDLKHFLQIFDLEKALPLKVDMWKSEIKEQRLKKDDTKELISIKGINPNIFVHLLSKVSQQASAFTTDVGNNQMWVAQSIEINDNQRFLSSGGMGAMGYSLPAAIGACFALNKNPIVCISGDGGFQINIQELQTVKRNELPIKIVILNNHCLGMIRQFQDSYFNSQYTSTVWGYSVPDFVAVANAYGINALRVEKKDQIETALRKMWENPKEPFLLDIFIDIHTNVYPKMLFGHPLTVMEPSAE